jgi:hypothetical protein
MKDAALANSQKLSNYNSLLAAGSAQLEVGRQLRAIQEAQAIGPAGKRLMEAQNRLENAQAPWDKLAASINTTISARWTELRAYILEGANYVVERLLTGSAAIFDWIPDFIDQNVEEWIRKNAAAFKNQNGPALPWDEWKKAMIDAELDLMNRLKGPRPPGGA